MFEVVIIWVTGDIDVYEYETREKATEIQDGMAVAFGNQIEWSCVRRKY